ncbi:amino acid adenylation domain-containing protein, partial [Corallococcus exiguus]|nr:amino acid adenylation domain-containing protein [Corallococcus exiguus]
LRAVAETSRFQPLALQRLLAHWRQALVSLTTASRLGDVSLLSSEERRQLLRDFNATSAPFPADSCIHHLFEAQSALRPDAVAIEFGSQRLTYRQLDSRANQLAHALRSHGVGPDDLVALCLERSVELVVSLLAILKAGAAYLPLDADYPAQRLAFMLEDAPPRLLLSSRALRSRLDVPNALPCLLLEELRLDTWPTSAPDSGVTSRNLAYVDFTSGSTGRPKGVAIEHRSVLRLFHGNDFARFGPDEAFLLIAPISFDASTLELWGPLLFGGRLVVFPPQSPSDLKLLRNVIEEHRVTTLHLTAGLLTQVVDLEPDALKGLRQVLTGGDVVSAPHVRRVVEQLALPVTACYGPTESTLFTSTHRMTRPEQVGVSVPIGAPIANTQVYLLDDALAPVPLGAPGELFIGGDGLARGYLSRPDLTAERFIPNPFSSAPGARLYRTGDLARWRDDGVLEFLGRLDHQVKLRGFRIELAEVEAALAAHPLVRQAIALVREDVPGDKRLVAYVVAQPEQSLDVAALRDFLRERLPEFMRPSSIVRLDALPLTSNAKVDRKALPAPEGASDHAGADFIPPSTPTEQALAALWTQVLRAPRVGRQDSFFALGGHSLLATQLVSRIRSAFGVELPLRDFFESPSLEALARTIDSRDGAALGPTLPPLVPGARPASPPLSFAQQRLWFLDQLESGSALYNMPMVLWLEGPLDPTVLERCFTELVRRHESLRTTFEVEEGQPVQRVAPPAPLKLERIDLGDLPVEERELHARRFAQQAIQQPFHLGQGPLLRATLLRLSDERHALVLCMHHIISDGWSLPLLMREMGTLYEAFTQGRPSPLPELAVQYADYAVWQRQWLREEELERQLAYWREQLSDIPSHLELPTDRRRPSVQTFRGTSHPVRLAPDLSASLRLLAQREGVTPFMLLLAAFQLLLSRYAGQDDISVGSPIAGRRLTELEGVIGFFINTLVLRTRIQQGASFRELLQRVRETTLGAYAHQDIPFEKLVEELKPERNLAHSPLFQVWFVLNQPEPGARAVSGLALRPLEMDLGVSKFDLTLFLSDTPEGLAGSFEYNTDLFDNTTIARLGDHLRLLLETVVADPSARLARLELLTPSERQHLLRDWNEARRELPEVPLVHRLFEAQVARTPDATALCSGEESLTYAQLNARANQLARHLRRVGVRPEVLVALCLERSLDFIIALLATLKAGGAFLPLDPHLPSERLDFIVTDAMAPVLLTHSSLEHLLDPRGYVLRLDVDEARFAREPEDNLDLAPDASSLAYVIYTSGSTGRPKGTLLQHRGLCNTALQTVDVMALDASSRVLQFSSAGFDACVWEVLPVLLAGGELHLAPREELMPGTPLQTLLRERAITAATLTPSVLLQLDARELGSLRTLTSAGEACAPELVERFAPGRRFVNAYGPTEATICATVNAQVDARHVTIGRPFHNVRAYVLDAQLRPLPIGVPGELYLGGAGLARGYLGRPNLTAERFIPNPFASEPGARLYRTGDRARWLPDGQLESLGRTDFQVKLRGFRIELGEVEAVLAQHSSVRETVVLLREDSPGLQRLVAYVVPAYPESPPDLGALRAWLKEKLPEYMVPASFVTLEALPLSSSGKVDRKALPVPEGSALAHAEDYTAPRDALEETLASLWAELLEVERVGVHDNFFDQGGHSLLATQVMSRLRARFGVELPLRALFEAPTVETLARRLGAALQQGQTPEPQVPPLTRAPREDGVPLSFAQQRLWFLDQLEPGSASYNIPLALHLEGVLQVDVLQRALEALVSRHEVLRTSLRTEAGEARQHIAPELWLPLTRMDLSAQPAEAREAEVHRQMDAEARRPFDLARGPLLRATLLRLEQDAHVLLFTLHHVISDAWSLGVMVREVAALYEAFAKGEPSPLAQLPVQYADYAFWQRQWLRDEALKAQLDWWRRQLAGAPAVLELPTDRPRPPKQSFRGARHGFTLSPATAERLRALAQREGATPFMLLLTVFQMLLARYSGQDDISVGSPIAGRRLAELEGLIGFFVNTLVLRNRVNAEASFRELLRQVRDRTLDVYAHQDLPFEHLVEAVQPERDLSVPPLFQVMLVVQNAPVSALRLPELRLRPLEVDSGVARFDLTLQFAEGPDGFIGSLEYNTDLFDASTAGRLAEHFQVLLESALQAPDTRVGRLALLTAPERRQLLTEWNTLQTHFARQGTLHGHFEDQAARTPHARALTFEGTHLTYGELNTRANQLAAWLRARGAGPESRIGLYLERSVELVVGLLAILKAGAAYVPMDPAHPRDRLAFLLEDAGVPLLLTQTSLVPNLPPHSAHVLCLDAEGPTLATLPTENVDAGAHEEHLAYVIYTSGSTGRPKGSLVTHANVLRLFSATRPWYDFSERDVWTLFHSSAFDFTVWELWGALLYGGRLVVVPYWVSRSPGDFHALLQREAVTVLNQTPSAFRQLIQHEESLEKPPPLALRYVIFGGEALDFRGLQPWFALHGDSQPRLINMYGITETTVHVTYRPLSARDASGTASVVGVPIPDLQAFILDASLEPVPVGIPGELYIGGRGLARGYLGRPGLTAERFIPHPFSTTPGARLYKTGDRARFRADGQIDYLGRTDFQVKLRGFRIELGEIEAVLEQQPGLQQALVLAREDRAGDKRLVAYVVPATGHAVDTATLRQELQAKLPEYMVPSAFVTLEALPLTSNGKVDRKALPAPDASAAPASEYVTPRTPVEQRLAELWKDVLGVERVGATDSFFELGGHSLLAVQVVSRIRATFGVDLPLRALFEHRDVESLARALEQLGADAREEMPARSTQRRPTPVGRATGPASMAQRRWLSYAGSNPNRPKSAGNVPRCVRIQGRLDVGALERALNSLVERHEILRTHYVRSDDGLAFQVPPPAAVQLEQLDFTGLPREQCEEAVRQRVYQDAQTPFDLMAPPLFRAWLYELGPEEHMLLMLTHHIAWDGWSEAIVLQEVTRSYQAYVRGEQPRLPELRIQYSDFAWWQHEQMQGEHLESIESYWRRHLADGVTMVDFPFDRPRPDTRSYNALSTSATFPEDLSAAIKAYCHREGVTLYMMAMAAYQALLALRSGARDITVFSNIGSRDHIEVENLIGCFTNVILIRTGLEGDPTFQEFVTRVRDAVLGALAHSALPYQRVLDMIGMNPDSKSARTFPGLNMQNFQKSGGPAPSLEGLQLDRVNIPQGSSLMVNMFFFVSESEDQRVTLMAQANGDLYEARTVDRIVEDFQKLLAAGCANPDRRLSELLP